MWWLVATLVAPVVALPVPASHWCSNDTVPWDRCGVEFGTRMMEEIANIPVRMPAWWEGLQPYQRKCPSCKPLWLLCPSEDTGAWDGGDVLRLSSRMVMETVNSQQWLLPGYELMCDSYNDQCDALTATQIVSDRLQVYPNKYVGVGIVGCSGVCKYIGSLMYFYKMALVSFAAGMPDLTDRKKFPNFFRVRQAHTSFTWTWIKVFKVCGWKKIALILAEEGRFRGHFEHMKSESQKAGLEVAYESQILQPQTQAKTVMQTIKDKRLRIIQLITYETTMRALMCAAHHLVMGGLVFLGFGFYNPSWYKFLHDPELSAIDSSCGVDTLKKIGNGAIFVTSLMYSDQGSVPFACDKTRTMTPNSFKTNFKQVAAQELSTPDILKRKGRNYYDSEPREASANGADGICLYAQVLSALLGLHPDGRRAPSGNVYTDEQLRQRGPDVYEDMNQLLQSASFNSMGLTPLRFNCDLPANKSCDANCRNKRGTSCTGDPAGSAVARQFNKSGTDQNSLYPIIFIYDREVDLGKKSGVVMEWRNPLMFDCGLYWGGPNNALLPPFAQSCVANYHKQGNYCVPNDSFEICAAGYTRIGQYCTPCNIGTYYDHLLGWCRNCPAGKQQLQTGTTRCNACQVGWFSSTEGGNCTNCTLGKYAKSPGASKCSSCDAGFFQDEMGTSACKLCEIGFFQPNSSSIACSPCPSHTNTFTKHHGSTKQSDCVCRTGHAIRNPGSCSKCIETGIRCPGGESPYEHLLRDPSPVLKKNYMVMPDQPWEVYHCNGGKDSNYDNYCLKDRGIYNASAMCPKGFRLSPQCTECKEGFYMDTRGCKLCGGSSGITAVLIIVGLLVAVILFLISIYQRCGDTPSEFSIACGSLLNFGQLLGILTRMDVTWVGVMGTLNTGLGYLFSAEGIMKATTLVRMQQCSFTYDFSRRIAFAFTLPLLIPFLYACMAFATWLAKRRMSKDKIINCVGEVFKALVVSISALALSLFASVAMPNRKNMLKDFPAVELLSREWWNVFPLGLAATLFYVVAQLSFIIKVVWEAPRKVSDDPRWTVRYAFIFGDTRPDTWWWVIAHIGYAFALNAAQVLSSNVLHQLLLTIFIVVLFGGFQSYIRPLQFRVNNTVEDAMCVAYVLVLVLATNLINPADIMNEGQTHEVFKEFANLCFVCCVIAVLGPLLITIKTITNLFRPPGVSMGYRFHRLLEFRHVSACINALPNKEFLRKVRSLNDNDLFTIELATRIIVTNVFQEQAGPNIWQQRLIPEAKFKCWQKGEAIHRLAKLLGDHSLDDHMADNVRELNELQQLRQNLQQRLGTVNYSNERSSQHDMIQCLDKQLRPGENGSRSTVVDQLSAGQMNKSIGIRRKTKFKKTLLTIEKFAAILCQLVPTMSERHAIDLAQIIDLDDSGDVTFKEILEALAGMTHGFDPDTSTPEFSEFCQRMSVRASQMWPEKDNQAQTNTDQRPLQSFAKEPTKDGQLGNYEATDRNNKFEEEFLEMLDERDIMDASYKEGEVYAVPRLQNVTPGNFLSYTRNGSRSRSDS